ncbi:MAG: flavin monoamine oxidase family protein, partial [Bacteroidia bacterium]
MRDLKRRMFIRNSIIAGIGTSIAPNILQGKTSKQHSSIKYKKVYPAEKKKVIVAGAGITGLCCGYELMKNGHDVT